MQFISIMCFELVECWNRPGLVPLATEQGLMQNARAVTMFANHLNFFFFRNVVFIRTWWNFSGASGSFTLQSCYRDYSLGRETTGLAEEPRRLNKFSSSRARLVCVLLSRNWETIRSRMLQSFFDLHSPLGCGRGLPHAIFSKDAFFYRRAESKSHFNGWECVYFFQVFAHDWLKDDF